MKRLGIGLAAAALVALSACGGGGKFTAKGTLGLVAVNAATEDCSSGTGGYEDIEEGASVVITGADDKKLAIGSLEAGKEHGSDGFCEWAFSVPDVPSGKGPYAVEITHRGQVPFTEKNAGHLSVSLGS